ncbi:hypothetical protein B484DRAFT_320592, partial [Ochromonadaceae sp. CCMP2298]
RLRLCDIGANILDEMFAGEYHGKQQHPSDTSLVLERARSMGVHSMIFTGSSVAESRKTLAFCNDYDNVFATVGVHPCSAEDFSKRGADVVIAELKETIDRGLAGGKIAALGEFGLDYDRLQYCEKETQLLGFERQLELAAQYDLPLFLHNRNT